MKISIGKLKQVIKEALSNKFTSVHGREPPANDAVTHRAYCPECGKQVTAKGMSSGGSVVASCGDLVRVNQWSDPELQDWLATGPDREALVARRWQDKYDQDERALKSMNFDDRLGGKTRRPTNARGSLKAVKTRE